MFMCGTECILLLSCVINKCYKSLLLHTCNCTSIKMVLKVFADKGMPSWDKLCFKYSVCLNTNFPNNLYKEVNILPDSKP